MHICYLVTKENFKFSNHTVHTDCEFCCFAVHTVESTHWLRVLRVTVGPLRSRKSDITLAYWGSCKDLVRGWSGSGDLVHLCSWRVQLGRCLRQLFQMEATNHLHVSSLSRIHNSSMQWWSLCLYTRSQILEALRWASIAFCCLISSCKWYQDGAVTSCHLSILATTDQIRQVSHSFCANFEFFAYFWNQQPD